MTQGERIKHIRQKRGMTQQELGEACGFSESSTGVRIRQYESKKNRPRMIPYESSPRRLKSTM